MSGRIHDLKSIYCRSSILVKWFLVLILEAHAIDTVFNPHKTIYQHNSQPRNDSKSTILQYLPYRTELYQMRKVFPPSYSSSPTHHHHSQRARGTETRRRNKVQRDKFPCTETRKWKFWTAEPDNNRQSQGYGVQSGWIRPRCIRCVTAVRKSCNIERRALFRYAGFWEFVSLATRRCICICVVWRGSPEYGSGTSNLPCGALIDDSQIQGSSQRWLPKEEDWTSSLHARLT